MEALLKRIRIIVVAFVIALTLLAIFGIFNPLQRIINEEKYNSFILKAELYEQALITFVEQTDDKTSLIGDDYDTKLALKAYKDGTKTYNETTAYLEAVFQSNLLNSEDILGLFIYQNGLELASYQTKIEEDPILTSGIQLIKLDNQYVLKHTHSIDDLSGRLGMLIVYYDLSPLIGNGENIELDLLLFNNHDDIQAIHDSSKAIVIEDKIIYRHEGHFDYFGEIRSTNIQYLISITEYDLFGQTNTVVQFAILFLVIVIILAYIMFNRAVFLKAHFLVETSNRMRKELAKLADYDSLTQAYSRSYFDRYVKNYKSLYDETFTATLVMVDFDDLKGINDTYGHLMGDQVLKRISQLILDSLRKNDYFFRFGGDEFIIILEDCDLDLANLIITRTIKTIQDENDKVAHHVSISYGLAQLDYQTDLNEAIHEADLMMYENKKQNKLQLLEEAES